jgi:hypothetical protein
MPPRKRASSRKSYAKIEGLDDFLKSMGVVDAELARAEKIFQTLAAATVITLAKDNAERWGRQQARAAETLQAIGSGTVQFGGTEWSMGAEFGSILYGQFPQWRGRGMGAGYFFWPAIEEFRDEDMINLWVREVWAQVENLFS